MVIIMPKEDGKRKQHWPTWIEINLYNIRHNVKEIKKRIGNDVCLMATVKADAYGHGLIEVAKTSLQSGAEKLAVANVDEGITLRKSGIIEPILIFVLSFEDAIEDIVKYNLMQTISESDLDFVKKLSEESVKQNKTVKINIKVNTGMNRNGVNPRNTLMLIKNINSYDNIIIEGIYTHLATSFIEEEFTNSQFNLFINVLDELEKNNIEIPYKHCCNTGGVLNFPHMYLNQVRPGELITSPYPALREKNNLDIKECFEFKSKIIILRDVDKGQSVGYDQTYYAGKNITIAVVSAGWGDGMPRGLANKGFVLVRGIKCPIIGSICCDQFFVDISDVSNVKVKDEVVIIGSQNDMCISVREWGEILGDVSEPLALRCYITDRVTKKYIN